VNCAIRISRKEDKQDPATGSGQSREKQSGKKEKSKPGIPRGFPGLIENDAVICCLKRMDGCV
jgi:hypothetical protein